jgi:hypothetical protein
MITESSIEIEASPEVVWRVFSQVERWPVWTPSVRRVTPLDRPDLAVGCRYEILQPRFPRLVWTVTELDVNRHVFPWPNRHVFPWFGLRLVTSGSSSRWCLLGGG